MKEHIDRMDKTIKEKFEDHEVSVPSHLWNSIEANLPSEGGNNGGGFFFFKKSFLLSILAISTVVIGTYIYNTKDTQINQTNITSATSKTTDATSNSSSHSANAENKNETRSENANTQTTVSSSSIDTENTSAIAHSKIQNNNNTRIHNNSERANGIQTKNTSLRDTSSNRNRRMESSTNADNATITASTPANIVASTESAKSKQLSLTDGSATSNQHADSNAAAAVQSAKTDSYISPSTDKNRYLTDTEQTIASSSDQLNDSSNTTNSSSSNNIENNTHTTGLSNNQALNKNASKRNIPVAVYADSIKQFTSAYIQKNNSSNNESVVSNTSIKNDILTNNTAANSNTSAVNKKTALNDSQISDATLSLNSTHELNTASETAPLYTNNSIASNTASDALIDQTLASNANTEYISKQSTSIDSVNNKTESDNSLHSNSDLHAANAFVQSTNSVINDVLLKVDSAIIAKDIDSAAAENPAEKMNVKTTDEQKKKSLFLSRCSFDGYAAPALGYIHLSPNNQETTTNKFITDRNKNANAGFGLTTGLRMNYALTQKIEIGIGLQYSSLNQQSSLTQQHLDSTYITYQGHTVTDSTYDSTSHRMIYTQHYVVTDTTSINAISSHVKKYTDKFQNITIPIHIAYGYSISNKLSLLARTSLLINYQTYSVTYLNTSDSTIIGHNSNKNISLGGSFSIGGYYQFSRSCSVFAEPIVYYYFSNVFDKQAPFKQTQFMLGLQTGIRFSF